MEIHQSNQVTLTSLPDRTMILQEEGKYSLLFSEYGVLLRILEDFRPQPWNSSSCEVVSILKDTKGNWEVYGVDSNGVSVKYSSKNKSQKGKALLREIEEWLNKDKIQVPLRRDFEHGGRGYKQVIYVFPIKSSLYRKGIVKVLQTLILLNSGEVVG